MSYNASNYFVSTYFPSYFQTVKKTEPLDRWVACGWVTPGWVAGRPCEKKQTGAGGYSSLWRVVPHQQKRTSRQEEEEFLMMLMSEL